MQPDLLQTVAILAACVVYLAKEVISTYKRRTNGKSQGKSTDDMVEDLHIWHRPVNDHSTGQPHFMWYHDNRSLVAELSQLRECIEKMNVSIIKLVGEIERLKQVTEQCSARSGDPRS